MIRRLDLTAPWRSLRQGFWPDELPSGYRTIVYGHNGSGKSTLSELLLSLAEGTCATDITWEDESGHRTSIGVGGESPSAFMAVFTRRWVEDNLSAFLDGASASAIVTLGKEAIDARDEERSLVEEIGERRGEAEEAAAQQKAATDMVDRLVRNLQDSIVSELQEFDFRYFTKHQFSAPRLKDALRQYVGAFPDNNAHAEALKRLGEGAPSPLLDVVDPPASVIGDLTGLAALLLETPTRVAIHALEGNPSVQTWVEQGLALHEGIHRCLFCSSEIASARRDQLVRHFDESWLQIRNRATALLSVVTEHRNALRVWQASLPAATSLIGGRQAAYADALARCEADVEGRLKVLAVTEAALSTKIADPGSAGEAPDLSVLWTAPSSAMLARAVAEHNDQARHHAEVTGELKQTVLDHLLGSQAEAFRMLEAQATDCAERGRVAMDAADRARQRLDDLRQARFTTRAMADTLTRDLARVYGKGHLSVGVTQDGKSYACRRGDKAATNLSDGERTTISLLYFLRRLEDEQTTGGDRSQRIVVIDDPSSSLDREAIFATHQWLLDRLKNFGQYIILTHDFSLLRLFIKSHASLWGKSVAKIKKNDEGETRFPRVAFLEMYAASVDGERRTRVGQLPHVLLHNTSEYTYLFAMVMAGIADSEDHERLFLLPNAARRVLEVFASYKAPHRTEFRQQLEALVEAQTEEPYRDVYDFCNRFSHGEGSESVDELDARAVHGQIRRCMEFLRSVDGEHFERMCTAAGIDPLSLP